VDVVPSALKASFTQAIQDYLSTPPSAWARACWY
jgi:hypothetical protein